VVTPSTALWGAGEEEEEPVVTASMALWGVGEEEEEPVVTIWTGLSGGKRSRW
jgi:hypothetical protein